MAGAEFLEIRYGCDRWLRVAQLLLGLLGFVAILSSPANWKWKLGTVLILFLLTLWVHLRAVHPSRSGTIRLFADGSAMLGTGSRRNVHAIQQPHGWVSRWISVLALRESENGHRHYCVICATDNPPNEYRRLLKFLRMHTPAAEIQRMIW